MKQTEAPGFKTCPICGGDRFSVEDVLGPDLIAQWRLTVAETDYVNRGQGLKCSICRSNLRSMTLASGVMQAFGAADLFEDFCRTHGEFRRQRILEINEAGSLTRWLRLTPQHRLARYPGVDMQRLDFAEGSWDLVIHSDTLEHVPDPSLALAECFRVLRPGGLLAFTVPMVVGRLTKAADSAHPSFHGSDGTRDEDYRVHTEFGADAWTWLMEAGFEAVTLHRLEFPASVALLARKPRGPGLAYTGERLTTALKEGRLIATEHLHRYAIGKELCRDLDVLDIACGEGYGSALLARTARSVTGVDIAEEAVEHASRVHGAGNLRFVRGSCVAIPLPDAAVDLVVSFETLEHLAEHDQFCREIRRVLRPGGLLLISSPDRKEYSERPGTINPYHVRELSRAEFGGKLRSHFSNVSLFLQKYLVGSCVVEERPAAAVHGLMKAGFSETEFQAGLPGATYCLALCSDAALPVFPAGICPPPGEVLEGWLRAIEASDSPQTLVDAATAAGFPQSKPALAARLHEVEAECQALQVKLGAARDKMEKLKTRIYERDEKLSRRRAELEALQASWGWRLTRLLRKLGRKPGTK